MLVDDELDKLVMVPGPSPVHREILAAIGRPTAWHGSRAVADVIRECQAGLKVAAGTDTATPILFSGSGTLAQEAAVVNLLAPGDALLVVSNGYFGDRFVAIAEAYGIEVDRLASPWGRSVTPDELAATLRDRPYAAVTITHVDTSTGAAAPLEGLAAAARNAGALVILDAVCSLGGMPIEMDRVGIDFVLSGAQKALGVPPGLSILLMSTRAIDRRKSLARIPAFYADVLNWLASMDDPTIYFSTHAVNLFFALGAAVRLLRREGLTDRFQRHESLARSFRAGVAALGLEPFAEPEFVAPTMTALRYPCGVLDNEFRAALADRGVVAAGALGELKGHGCRFGHMGNITEAEILRTLSAVEGALIAVGALPADATGRGVAAARSAPGVPVPV